MALKGFEQLYKVAKKANSVKKSPSIKKGGLLNRIKQAENLASEKLGRFDKEYKCVYTKEELKSYLLENIPEKSHIALDTETGPRPGITYPKASLDYYDGWVVGICLTAPNKPSVYVPVNHVDPTTGERLIKQVKVEDVTEIFEEVISTRPDIKFDYHNAEFDIRMMLHTFNLSKSFIDTVGWDTLIVAYCIDEEKRSPHGLKELHKIYYPEQYEGRDFSYEVVEFNDLFGDVPFAFISPEIAKLYAAGDTFKTMQVKEKQIEELSKPGNEKFFKEIKEIELGCIAPTIRMEERGMKIDIDLLNKLDKEYSKLIEVSQAECYKELEKFSDKIQKYREKYKNQKKSKLDNPIKLNSPAQINTLFFDVLGVKIEKKNSKLDKEDESSDSADKDALLEITRKYPTYKLFVKNLLKFRNASKMKSTYIDSIREKIRPDGKIHCTFKPFGAVTGRFSCTNPNLQNIPKDPVSIRNMFIAEDGFVLGGGDYSKQEVFLTTEECLDPALIQVFKEGKDIYSVLASTIYGVPYRECLEFETNEDGSWKLNEIGERISYHIGKMRRGTGKTGWLGLTYGLGPAGLMAKANTDLQKEIDEKVELGEEVNMSEYHFITLEEATHILDQIKKGFPTAFKWIDRTHEFAHKNGYVENMYGRRRHLKDILLPKFSISLLTDSNGNVVTPSCLEEDPLDWNSDTLFQNLSIDDVPPSIYTSYVNELNKAKSKFKIDEIKKALIEKEKLTVKSNGQFIAKAERQAVNSKIQGDACCLIKHVMINLDKSELLRKYNSGLVNTVHDEVLLQVDKNHIKECMNEINKVMVETAALYVKSVKVKSDLVAATCWYGEFVGKELPWRD